MALRLLNPVYATALGLCCEHTSWVDVMCICAVHVKTWWATYLLLDTCVLACIGCVYLAYILAFVLHDLCIVCISTYVVNFYLLYASYQRYQHAWFIPLQWVNKDSASSSNQLQPPGTPKPKRQQRKKLA